jgi:hypothetical protein
MQQVVCRVNEDCESTEKCITNEIGQAECVDACNGAVCGRNAECSARDHGAFCSCRTGFFGNPQTGCQPIECNTNNECSNDKLCEDHMCKIACLVSNSCGPNALCSAEKHKQVCYCQPGFTGDAQIGCTLINFCASNPCGPGANCDNAHGSYKCLCPLGTVGDPYSSGCVQPVECIQDEDCPVAAQCTRDGGEPKCKGKNTF